MTLQIEDKRSSNMGILNYVQREVDREDQVTRPVESASNFGDILPARLLERVFKGDEVLHVWEIPFKVVPR